MSKDQATANVNLTGDGQTGKFVRDNQKSLLFIAAAILAMVLIYIASQVQDIMRTSE